MRYGLILTALLGASVATPVAQIPRNPDATMVLPKATAWVQALEKQFAAVIADETYHQQIGDAPSPADPGKSVRDLQSEIAFLWVPEDGMWLTARNVRMVDKVPVSGSSPRLQRLMADPNRVRLLRGLRGESSTFNLGTVNRGFSDPTYALQYLDPRWQGRFIWAQNGRERLNDVETWRFDFTELNQPYIIQAAGYTLQSTGNVWIDPATGVAHRTHLEVWDSVARVRTRIDVELTRDAKLGMVVPTQMKEEYIAYTPTGLEVSSTFHGAVEYRNFRRLASPGR